MSYVVFENDLNTWAVALAIGVACVVLLLAVKRLVVRRLGKFASRTATVLDDLAVRVLSATHPLFICMLSVYVAAQWLTLPDKSMMLLARATIAVVLLQVAHWGDLGVREWLAHYRMQRSALDVASTTSTAALGFVARTALWLIVALMILDNFGVNITTLVASLGIGGIAVALALQNILGDLFSSLSIVLDKPFVVGDFITVDDIAGTVEHVGLKTTRIRSLGGEQVVFSNSDLLKSRIRNYKRMQTRRIVFGIGVTYEITEEQLLAIPGMIRTIVEAQPNVAFDRAHFKSYGASSLDFEVVYNVTSPDYGIYMDIQQAINVGLFKRFADESISFAYPTQTVYLAKATRSSRQDEVSEAVTEVAQPGERLQGVSARHAQPTLG